MTYFEELVHHSPPVTVLPPKGRFQVRFLQLSNGELIWAISEECVCIT